MKVTIDSREQNRIKSATTYYEKQGLTVEIAELESEDYVFNDQVAFEFKTIADFITSIQDGRVFNQAITMSETYNYSFVIIQGNEATRTKCLAISRNFRPVTVYQYLGAIASLNKYVTVIESYSPFIEEAYYRMLSTATKALNKKPIVRKFPKKHKNPALNFLTYSIYGINYKKAHAIVEAYDLKTLSDLQELTIEKLIAVDGIGQKNAERIIEAIK